MVKLLQDELRQRAPFRSLEQEAHLSIVRTAAQLSDAFERLLAPSGLTPSQYNVLRILRGAEPDGLCRNEVRDRMLTRMPDMTRMLDRMEKAGLVTRSRADDDRRVVTTLITERGKQILDELEPKVAIEHRQRLGHLSQEDLRQLIDLLAQVRDPA